VDAHQIAAIAIALLTIVGMLARPWRSAEWHWAVGGAIAEIAIGGVTGSAALAAVAAGANVYAFLIGILALAETARSQAIFEWLAGRAAELTSSRARLLGLVYLAGVLVTATLSNDTAIIVLTPAALALGRRIGGSPVPYLLACAFVANAASFLLPTGNPANLLFYGPDMPGLGSWLSIYGLAALAAIALTFVALAWGSRTALREPARVEIDRTRSTPLGRLALGLLGASALALVIASAFGLSLGATALSCAIVATAVLWFGDRTVARTVVRGTAWSVVPLVAGLLVVVAALEGAGVTRLAARGLDLVRLLPGGVGREVAGFATTVLANAANNLPAAVFAGRALTAAPAHPLAHAVLVGIDLGPNLSVGGSLATLLWLIALRREGVEMTPLRFFFSGALVTIPAMFVALLLVR
jgi:arsenical pump membrane protein